MTSLNVAKDFSCLDRSVGGQRLVYLDAAASTPSPDIVLEREARARRFTFANVHRGQHALADEATEAYEGARRRVARFLRAEPRCIVFTRGTTESINLVARGLRLTEPGLVLTTLAEHHSNFTPWQRQRRVVTLEHDLRSPLEPRVVAEALDRYRPALFAFHHASNVTGIIQPAAELCRVARERGVLTFVDAAQSAPHLPLDVSELGCDFLAFSGHKLLGPKGIGVLFGRHDSLARVEPLSVGGGAVREVTPQGFGSLPAPEGLEAGTPNVTGAVGLAAALDYLDTLGMSAVQAHGARLAAELRDVAASLPGFDPLLSTAPQTLPLLSLVPRCAAVSSNQLATFLSDSAKIMVRSGLLCAHPLFERFGVKTGALRVSAHIYNDSADVHAFAENAERFMRRLG